MPALSYSKQNIEKYDFENKILQGIKKHTIRKYRKRLFQVGDTLYHYKNWRTPQVTKICENICLYVANIKIYETALGLSKIKIFLIKINDKKIYGKDYSRLAINDGFDSYKQFKSFFIKAGLPFHGQIIGWVEGIEY